MSISDIPKWAHLYTLANYYENCQESYFIAVARAINCAFLVIGPLVSEILCSAL